MFSSRSYLNRAFFHSLKMDMEKSEIDLSNDCPICLQELDAKKFTTVCDHTFHERCLKTWLSMRETCPFCRMELKTQDIFPKNKVQLIFSKFHLQNIIDSGDYIAKLKQLINREVIVNFFAVLIATSAFAIPITCLVLQFRNPDLIALLMITVLTLAVLVGVSVLPESTAFDPLDEYPNL